MSKTDKVFEELMLNYGNEEVIRGSWITKCMDFNDCLDSQNVYDEIVVKLIWSGWTKVGVGHSGDYFARSK